MKLELGPNPTRNSEISNNNKLEFWIYIKEINEVYKTVKLFCLLRGDIQHFSLQQMMFSCKILIVETVIIIIIIKKIIWTWSQPSIGGSWVTLFPHIKASNWLLFLPRISLVNASNFVLASLGRQDGKKEVKIFNIMVILQTGRWLNWSWI